MKSIRPVLAVLAALSMAASLGADPVKMENPILDAKVGEWASYSMPQGIEQKMTVSAVDDNSVTVKVEMSMAGQKLPGQTVTTNLKAEKDKYDPEKHPDVKITEETLTIKGSKIKCTVATMTGEDGKQIKSFLSGDIPVYGIVKLVHDGKSVMILTDWGKK